MSGIRTIRRIERPRGTQQRNPANFSWQENSPHKKKFHPNAKSNNLSEDNIALSFHRKSTPLSPAYSYPHIQNDVRQHCDNIISGYLHSAPEKFPISSKVHRLPDDSQNQIGISDNQPNSAKILPFPQQVTTNPSSPVADTEPLQQVSEPKEKPPSPLAQIIPFSQPSSPTTRKAPLKRAPNFDHKIYGLRQGILAKLITQKTALAAEYQKLKGEKKRLETQYTGVLGTVLNWMSFGKKEAAAQKNSKHIALKMHQLQQEAQTIQQVIDSMNEHKYEPLYGFCKNSQIENLAPAVNKLERLQNLQQEITLQTRACPHRIVPLKKGSLRLQFSEIKIQQDLDGQAYMLAKVETIYGFHIPEIQGKSIRLTAYNLTTGKKTNLLSSERFAGFIETIFVHHVYRGSISPQLYKLASTLLGTDSVEQYLKQAPDSLACAS